jgi:hypothetical protein
MVINVCFTRFILDHVAPDPVFTGARTLTKLKSGQIIAATKITTIRLQVSHSDKQSIEILLFSSIKAK